MKSYEGSLVYKLALDLGKHGPQIRTQKSAAACFGKGSFPLRAFRVKTNAFHKDAVSWLSRIPGYVEASRFKNSIPFWDTSGSLLGSLI